MKTRAAALCACLYPLLAPAAAGVLDALDFRNPGSAAYTLTRATDVARIETTPLSEIWVCRGSGKSHNLFNWRPKGWTTNHTYTLCVTARSFAGENALNALVMKRRRDGSIAEGYYPASGILLAAGFREYRFPFTTDACMPDSINFYKTRPTDPDKGIDIAAVRLLDGAEATLDILPIYRGGHALRGTGKKPVAGTALPLHENPYGRRAEKMNVLAVGLDARAIRTVQEAFAGLNADLDVIVGPSSGEGVPAGDDQDTFYSDSPAEKVLTRLEKNAYALYVILPRAARLVGRELYRHIETNVMRGAGIVAYRNYTWGRLEKIVGPLRAADWKRENDFPYEPKTLLKEGTFGKGRVIFINDWQARIAPPPMSCGLSDFPYGELSDLWLATCFYRAAGIREAPGTHVAWTLVSSNGAARATGVASTREEALREAKGALETYGRHTLTLLSRDDRGFTTACAFASWMQQGPHFTAFTALDDVVSGTVPARFQVDVAAAGAPSTATWTLEDFSGRILARGAIAPGRPFSVPTRALYTNLGLLRICLHEAGRRRDALFAPVIARDRDLARTYDDFTVSIWPAGALLSKDATEQAAQRMTEIGIRHALIPYGWAPYLPLRMGLAMGGFNMGSYGTFGAHPQPLDSNVRTKGAINTAAARAAIARKARAAAARSARYGVVGAALTDEPGLVARFSPSEPDEQPENIAEYRRRMAEKYGTIENFNRRHATAYAAFGELRPAHLADARASGRFAEYVEWRTFNVDRWCEAIKCAADAASSADPTLKLSLFNSFGQTAASGNDYWKLLTRAGLGLSHEYTEMVYFGNKPIYNFSEFYRSFRPDLRVWGFIGYGMTPDQIRFAPWWFAAHRYGGLTWFSTWTWEYQLLDMPTLAYTQDALALKSALSASRLQEGLGALMRAYAWAKREIALYYSHESLLVATALGTERRSYDVAKTGPLHDYMFSRQGLVRTLEGLLYQYDFLAPERLAAGALNDYRILFMPQIIALSDAEVSALKAFRARGGRIVADTLPGTYDELGLKRPVSPFEPNELDTLGTTFDEKNAATCARIENILTQEKIAPVVRVPPQGRVAKEEAMRFTDGTNDLYVVLRWPDEKAPKAEQTFSFAPEGFIHNVRTGADLGRGREVRLTLPAAEAACWSVTRGHTEGVTVEGPRRVKRGEDFVAQLGLILTAGPAGTRLFHVTFARPDGTSPFHFARTVPAPEGRAACTFRFAFNDPAGVWQLKVTDVLTGVSATQALTVE